MPVVSIYTIAIMTGPGKGYYCPEVRDLKENITIVISAKDTSLMLENKIDTQYSQFKIYLHGRLTGQQKFKLDRFAKDLQKYRDKRGGLMIGGHFHADGDIRFVYSAQGSMPPIEPGCDERSWKTFYWSWKYYSHDQLAEFFHIYSWRCTSRKFLQRVYRHMRITTPFRLPARER